MGQALNSVIIKINGRVNITLPRCRIVSPIFYSLGIAQANESIINYLETKGKIEISNSTTFMAGYVGCAVGYSFKSNLSFINTLCSINSTLTG